MSWISAWHEISGGQIVAIDGKTLRRSFAAASSKSAIHMVSAWATANCVTLGQIVVDDKSNEITAIPKLLEMLELSGCLVTIDAIDALAGLPHLRWLTIECASSPIAKDAELRHKLPNVTLRYRLGSLSQVHMSAGWDGPDWASELQGNWQKSRTNFMEAFEGTRQVTLISETQHHFPSLVYLNSLDHLTWHVGKPVPVDTLPLLSHLTNLSNLDLHCKEITQAEVELFCASLTNLLNLRSLTIRNAILNDQIVSALGRCAALRELYFSWCTVPMGEDDLFARLPQLKRSWGYKHLERQRLP